MVPAPWKTVRSQYLHSKPWLTIRQDHVRLPNGAEIEDFYVLEYPTWVNALAITADEKIVLIRQYRHALGEVHFELPAGACDAQYDDWLAAARRELLEETGFGGGDWELFMTLSVNAGTHTNLSHTYLAKGVKRLGEASLEPTEDIVVHLVDRDELTRLVMEGGIVQALHSAPILKYLLVSR